MQNGPTGRGQWPSDPGATVNFHSPLHQNGSLPEAIHSHQQPQLRSGPPADQVFTCLLPQDSRVSAKGVLPNSLGPSLLPHWLSSPREPYRSNPLLQDSGPAIFPRLQPAREKMQKGQGCVSCLKNSPTRTARLSLYLLQYKLQCPVERKLFPHFSTNLWGSQGELGARWQPLSPTPGVHSPSFPRPLTRL